MKRSYLVILFFTISIFTTIQAQRLDEGYWKSQLKLQNNYSLDFHFSIDEHQQMIIYNDTEEVELNAFEKSDDSIKVYFTNFPTYLIFKASSSKSLKGYFVNPDRKGFKRIEFEADFAGKKLNQVFDYKKTSTDIAGKWEVYFNPNTKHEHPAIGLFKQQKSKASGTFLTETGDYRFLSGNVKNNKLVLSCFDGAHVFLFSATLENDTLKGKFLSGIHYQTNWYGIRNENFELKDPDSLTYLVNDEFKFNVETVENEVYNYPNDDLKNKVVIIQIIGTWCPNCLDETRFYKELYEEYNEKGLEIVGVAYEVPKTFEGKVDRINRFTKNKEIEYPILVGGYASKKESSEDFGMLNEISSFPTSVFINKDGKVVKIHTGFNGPGTGKIYEDYKIKTKALVERLLNE
ncbi:TlpA disulfide reductase family protein [Brumimicrobium aurantiacum]|uniref:TlpA family protein disulfide reductase n=1 Tax=Brumimicrobium aurantiacum TaxID=1737063 RepID=A0A3E1F217_9FLAO|nr:TlpA disulfide reductase family protein [Brumimicrobium aurantiacum]RFC55878.1 TlpA family protein disulfide reductase [Brumimicrobium aurantiacum]